MPKFESSTSYSCPAVSVFNAAAQAVQNLPGGKLKEVNQQGWYITASVSFNCWSYGENITVQMTEPAPGQPSMSAFSSSVFAIIDFGKNRRNIEKFFAEVQNVLAQAGHAQPQTAAGVQQVPTAAFCTNCGAPQRGGARFCTTCGRAMPAG